MSSRDADRFVVAGGGIGGLAAASVRAALLGDAAHPTLQYLAQGACMAMDDSACCGFARK